MTAKGNPPDRERVEFILALELKPNHGCPVSMIVDYIHWCLAQEISSLDSIIKSIIVTPATSRIDARNNLLASAIAKKRGEI